MITLLLTVAIVGFLVYLIVTYVPMPPIFQTVIIGLAVLCLLLYVIRAFGVADLPLPR